MKSYTVVGYCFRFLLFQPQHKCIGTISCNNNYSLDSRIIKNIILFLVKKKFKINRQYKL